MDIRAVNFCEYLSERVAEEEIVVPHSKFKTKINVEINQFFFSSSASEQKRQNESW